MKKILASLPKVDRVLAEERVQAWSHKLDAEIIKETVRQSIDDLRQSVLTGDYAKDFIDYPAFLDQLDQNLQALMEASLKPVVNATGTILHTNLGRAPLSQAVIEAITQLGPGYSNLEYDLEAGKRGSRYVHLQEVVCEITGAEDALVVNNNAAAVLLMLSALTAGREVLISRGELVEIGGSFRIPEVITQGGAILHEVGATNKTHLKDYAAGINPETGAILRVHTSNYKLLGFTEKPEDADLVTLAHDHGLLALNDLGSGLFLDMQDFGLPYEPTVQKTVAAGYDLVTFSGDKLLGGPQAGIIVGRKALLDILRSHPLTRAIRTDKLTLAALEVTMRQYLHQETALQEIPVLKMMGQTLEKLRARADRLTAAIQALGSKWRVGIVPSQSQVGGGSYPGAYLDTFLVEVSHDRCSASQVEHYLRGYEPAIIVRVARDQVQFDMRTLSEQDLDLILQALRDMPDTP